MVVVEGQSVIQESIYKFVVSIVGMLFNSLGCRDLIIHQEKDTISLKFLKVQIICRELNLYSLIRSITRPPSH